VKATGEEESLPAGRQATPSIPAPSHRDGAFLYQSPPHIDIFYLFSYYINRQVQLFSGSPQMGCSCDTRKRGGFVPNREISPRKTYSSFIYINQCAAVWFTSFRGTQGGRR